MKHIKVKDYINENLDENNEGYFNFPKFFVDFVESFPEGSDVRNAFNEVILENPDIAKIIEKAKSSSYKLDYIPSEEE